MNNSLVYIFLISFTIFIACKKQKKTQIDLEQLVAVELPADTSIAIIKDEKLLLNDTAVIFFWPSSEERTKIMNKYSDNESFYLFQTLFTDFLRQYNTLKSSLARYKIPVKMTYAKQFTFTSANKETITTELAKEGQIMGYLLFDGHNPPLFRYGLQKTNILTNDIKTYFRIPQFTFTFETTEIKSKDDDHQ